MHMELLDSPAIINAWVVFLDIYGFSYMLEGSQTDTIHKTMLKCYSAVYKLLRPVKDKYLLYFLDSIFLVFPVEPLEHKAILMRQCINKAVDIMGVFVNNGFPLRGGMAYGEICHSANLLIGKAVVNAVKYESLVEAPLLVLPFSEYEQYSSSAEFTLGDIILLKNDFPVFAHLFHPFPKDEYFKTVDDNFRRYCLNGPAAPAKAWYNAKRYIESLSRRNNGY